jgi:nucleotide-binding universal stress UspA family protein
MLRIQKILCPIDFSEFSRHAFDRAVAIAHGFDDATVTAVHVVPNQPTTLLPYMDATGVEPLVLRDVDRARLVEDMKQFLAVEAGGHARVALDVVEAPTVYREIVAQADRLHADLIVMGTHGRSGFQRLLLGSVAEKVVRMAGSPVLTVGPAPDVVQTGGASASFKRILCAIDFSDCSIAALRYASALAERAQADLTVLYVVEWTPIGYDPLMGPPTDLAGYRVAAEIVARDRLHTAIPEAARKTCRIEEIVSSGKPHHEILRISDSLQSDLIVLGVHGRNPFDRMIFGSTVEPVVRRAACPVLTVRSTTRAVEAAA